MDFFARKTRDYRQNQIAAKQRESCFMEVYGKRKCTFSDYTPKLFVHGSKTCAITKELAPFAYFTPKLRVKFSKFCVNNKKMHLFQIFLQKCFLVKHFYSQKFLDFLIFHKIRFTFYDFSWKNFPKSSSTSRSTATNSHSATTERQGVPPG